jgi:hypothetical protein
MRNRFKSTDVLEVLSPGASFLKTFPPEHMEKEDGTPLTDAYLVKERFYIYTDIPLRAGDILRKKK